MRKYFNIAFIIFPFLSHSQVRGDYVWELGLASHSGQGLHASGIEMNFNDDSLLVDTFYRFLFMDYFNASISDSEGNLLLYSNGCQVRDGKHEFISESNNINPGDINGEWCLYNNGGYPIFEGGIFLPFNDDSVINLFHQRTITISPPIKIYVDTLFFSQFVMKGDSYILMKKTVPVVGDTMSQGNLEAIKTIDGKGWWLIQQVQSSNKYYIVKVQNGEIDTIITQQIGDINSAKSLSQSVFSPDGKKYARFTPKDQLFLFDFDRETGLLSNYERIFVVDTNDYSGIAFSSNGRYLYTSTTKDLYQFDVLSSEIEASKIHIGHYDGYGDPFPTKFYLMQLGPDCRIYINTTNGNKAWHVIQEPDEQGLACRFEQHAFHFPVSNSITMPNFPVFRVNEDQPCNPDIKTGFFEYYVPPLNLDIFPNPAKDILHINLPETLKNERSIQIQIMDQIGRIWKQKKIDVYEGSQVMECEDLPAGLYFIQVKSEGKWIIEEFVKL